MAKLLIISDSHGLTNELIEIKKRHQQTVDAMIHCGDSELPYNAPEMNDFIKVKGNCDFDSSYLDELTEEIQGSRVFVTHGHLYNVKMSLMSIQYKAEEVDAKIACFGHSHVAGSFQENNIVFINPGSILIPRRRPEPTYVIAEIEEKEMTVRFFNAAGSEVEELAAHYVVKSK
ncbi:metallophosphoesterase [Bacillus taeanensis]|uniref:Phosphoesterase n=1 Tax=Bacillus taeanensis TaxID=273032 RepID=A0A366Y038_9BACI|nr:metallophosphoesterase [Bacillus taeanensis]RBW71557.1 YfcE family phosphodiesterase [Bacillus taeanensis]